jgi:hypothetical protein
VTHVKRAIRPLLARSLKCHACGACLALLAGGSVLGCPGSTTTATFTPITGITISASALLRGYRCGDGPGDVYKYSAVLWSASTDGGPQGSPRFSDVWDCYVDGVFQNLPAADGGSETFFLQVFAYTRSGFPAELSCPTGYGANGSPCAPLADASIAEQAGASAQWQTTCTATQQSGAPANAACAPLTPLAALEAGAPGGDAGVDAAPDGPGADSGAADGADGSEPAEASAEAGADAPPDAPADAPPDAASSGTDAPLG